MIEDAAKGHADPRRECAEASEALKRRISGPADADAPHPHGRTHCFFFPLLLAGSARSLRGRRSLGRDGAVVLRPPSIAVVTFPPHPLRGRKAGRGRVDADKLDSSTAALRARRRPLVFCHEVPFFALAFRGRSQYGAGERNPRFSSVCGMGVLALDISPVVIQVPDFGDRF